MKSLKVTKINVRATHSDPDLVLRQRTHDAHLSRLRHHLAGHGGHPLALRTARAPPGLDPLRPAPELQTCGHRGLPGRNCGLKLHGLQRRPEGVLAPRTGLDQVAALHETQEKCS